MTILEEKIIVIQEIHDNVMVGLLEDHVLTELYVEKKSTEPLVGSIYRGRVVNVLPGMQAAFVDIGLEKNAFLYVQEAIPPMQQQEGEEKTDLPPIEQVVNEGQEILVQLIKEPTGQKGARISTHISLAGRYLVLMPRTENVGISRKIEQDIERQRLTVLAEQLLQPKEGLIIRTVAQGRTREDLEQDLAELRLKWQKIIKKFNQTKATNIIYKDLALGQRLVRDFIKDEVSQVIVNERGLYGIIKTNLEISSPQHIKGLKYVDEDVFLKYDLYTEINKALKRKVWLKSGGYLVFDQTEALLVVDVNTGKYVGHNSLEDTVVSINLEAVKEACRQIKLRNIGGIIVIDFIDMKEEEHKEAVLKALMKEVKKDKMRVTILGMTSLGLVEITRKKVRPSLASILQKKCPACDGTGLINREEH